MVLILIRLQKGNLGISLKSKLRNWSNLFQWPWGHKDSTPIGQTWIMHWSQPLTEALHDVVSSFFAQSIWIYQRSSCDLQGRTLVSTCIQDQNVLLGRQLVRARMLCEYYFQSAMKLPLGPWIFQGMHRSRCHIANFSLHEAVENRLGSLADWTLSTSRNPDIHRFVTEVVVDLPLLKFCRLAVVLSFAKSAKECRWNRWKGT